MHCISENGGTADNLVRMRLPLLDMWLGSLVQLPFILRAPVAVSLTYKDKSEFDCFRGLYM